MKHQPHSTRLTLPLLAVALLLTGCQHLSHAQNRSPKRVLVVSTTMGFRHSSIPTAEKVLGELAQQCGEFTVDYARVEPNDPQFKGADGKPDAAKVKDAITQVLSEKMSAAALKNYDGVIFANTTGDLPLPDPQAFFDWIKAGHGFMGMHSATDTLHGHPAAGPLTPYTLMIGAEFKTHHAQAVVDCINQDPQHPACCNLGPTFHVKDEIYLMNGFERSQVHGLLSLDQHPNEKTPGDYPIAWCKAYGKGRVFYTSLGHREDVWDANTPPSFKRDNPPEVSLAYRKHILGGIRWALGLAPGDAKPQTAGK